MNFFEHQERARKRSGWLVILFGMAVFLIVTTCYLVVQAIFVYQARRHGEPSATSLLDWWNPRMFLYVAAPVTGIIAIAALSKMSLLKQGGAWVAQSLGGKQVLPGTSDPAEKRFLNIVEEMALASGVPVPPAFVLQQEQGINAFAAGNTPADAAVAVTRGALETLNRDELQGVVAHEFSHIVNGDMRLNIRLMGLLAGILALAVVGWHIIRFAPRGRNSKGGGGVVIAGLTLVALGYGGVFIGRLIQSAVSRQREFLADASAVQFTRNPLGIGGALKKIAGYSGGSLIYNSAAQEARHMFFGEAVTGFIASIFATHPPLKERIRRIDPQFNPEMERLAKEQATQQRAARRSGETAAPAAAMGFAQEGAAPRTRVTSDEALSATGHLTPETVQTGRAMADAVSEPIRQLLQHPFSASAMVTALMLDSHNGAREEQMVLLAQSAGEAFARETRRVFPLLENVKRPLRLALADMAMPALQQMTARQANAFQQTLIRLALADNQLTLSEFCLLKVVESRLGQLFRTAEKQHVYHDVRRLGPEVAMLLTALAWAGNPQKAEQAFRSGTRALAWAAQPTLGAQAFDARELSNALNKLAAATPQVRKAVFRACAEVVLLDQTVSDDEAELLRAVGYCLALPLPPFLPSVSA